MISRDDLDESRLNEEQRRQLNSYDNFVGENATCDTCEQDTLYLQSICTNIDAHIYHWLCHNCGEEENYSSSDTIACEHIDPDIWEEEQETAIPTKVCPPKPSDVV